MAIDKSMVEEAIFKTESCFSAKQVISSIRLSPARVLNLHTLDSKYWALPLATWQSIIQRSEVDILKYETDRYDCDDYAFSFKSYLSNEYKVNGCGIVIDFDNNMLCNLLLVKQVVAKDSILTVRFLDSSNGKILNNPKYNHPEIGIKRGGLLLI